MIMFKFLVFTTEESQNSERTVMTICATQLVKRFH